MPDNNFFSNKFIEALRLVHKEMMDEKALLDEMSDEFELTESDIFAMYHYFEKPGDNNGSGDGTTE